MSSTYSLLYKKYNKLILSREEVAKELGMSTSTLMRRINEGEWRGCYQKVDKKNYQFFLESLCKEMDLLQRMSA